MGLQTRRRRTRPRLTAPIRPAGGAGGDREQSRKNAKWESARRAPNRQSSKGAGTNAKRRPEERQMGKRQEGAKPIVVLIRKTPGRFRSPSALASWWS